MSVQFFSTVFFKLVKVFKNYNVPTMKPRKKNVSRSPFFSCFFSVKLLKTALGECGSKSGENTHATEIHKHLRKMQQQKLRNNKNTQQKHTTVQYRAFATFEHFFRVIFSFVLFQFFPDVVWPFSVKIHQGVVIFLMTPFNLEMVGGFKSTSFSLNTTFLWTTQQ